MSAKIGIETNYLHESVDRFEKETKELTGSELRAKVHHDRELLRDLAIKTEEATAANSDLKLAIGELRRVRYLYPVVIVLGAFLGNFGFRNWLRIQRIQDEVVEKELTRAKGQA